MAALQKSKPFKDPIVTEIVPAGAFAEEYHQDYYKKNPLRAVLPASCGRDAAETLWGDKAAAPLNQSADAP